MLIILPAEGGYEEFERDLDADVFSTLVDALAGNEGSIRLPRFAIESSFQLSNALSALGMDAAFAEGTADFGGIVDDGEIWIDEVCHDTFVTVIVYFCSLYSLSQHLFSNRRAIYYLG